MTRHDELLPYARVFLGDLTKAQWSDDNIIAALRVATAVVQLLGYDRGHTSDPSGVTPSLSERERAVWAKAAAVLLQDPQAMRAALEAVSVRTLGTSYSTEARARFMDAAASEQFAQLTGMIRGLTSPLRGAVDDLDRDVPRTF
jgi:hypothetical protein